MTGVRWVGRYLETWCVDDLLGWNPGLLKSVQVLQFLSTEPRFHPVINLDITTISANTNVGYNVYE